MAVVIDSDTAPHARAVSFDLPGWGSAFCHGFCCLLVQVVHAGERGPPRMCHGLVVPWWRGVAGRRRRGRGAGICWLGEVQGLNHQSVPFDVVEVVVEGVAVVVVLVRGTLGCVVLQRTRWSVVDDLDRVVVDPITFELNRRAVREFAPGVLSPDRPRRFFTVFGG